MLDYFNENSLSLNLLKSGYIIINGTGVNKADLILQNGILEYKQEVTYLGVKFTDTGNLQFDVDLYIAEKRSNVIIKFSSFCKRNFLAPLDIKLKVLNTCASASLIYSCETWGDCKLKNVETLYRQGHKMALSVRDNVSNEIVYVESE